MTLSSRRIEVLKAFDAWAARVVPAPKGPRRALASRPPRDVLLVRLWGLGNLAMLAPVLRANRERRLRVLTLERNVAFLRAHAPHVETLPVALPPAPRAAGALIAIARELRADPPDVVVDLEQLLHLPLILARTCSGAPTLGLDTPGQHRGRWLDVAVPYDPTRHVADTFATLCGRAGLAAPRGPGGLVASDAGRTRARRLLGGERRPIVVLHPGSGDHFPGRRWDARRFAALAVALAQRRARVVLTGDRSERELCARVRRLAHTAPPLDLGGRLDVEALVALLERATLLVTNDTGPLHLADALGTTSVALYGPNTPHRYGPRLAASTALFADLPCSPCLDDRTRKRSSCRHYACMDAIDVGSVLTACTRALEPAPEPTGDLGLAVPR